MSICASESFKPLRNYLDHNIFFVDGNLTMLSFKLIITFRTKFLIQTLIVSNCY